MEEKQPFWVKSIHTEDMGDGYARVTVTFRWWYRPIAWLNMLLSRRVG